MRNVAADIDKLNRLIQEDQERLAKFEEEVGQLDLEPERCVRLLNLMCGHLNELIRERDQLVLRERGTSR